MSPEDAAAGVGVSDLMEVRLFIERSCEHVQERYRKRYIDIYTGMVVDSVLELKKGSPLRADHDEENTLWVLRRLNETRTPLLAGLTVLHRTLIRKEPLHPEGTPSLVEILLKRLTVFITVRLRTGRRIIPGPSATSA